jgi:hypothetical protein
MMNDNNKLASVHETLGRLKKQIRRTQWTRACAIVLTTALLGLLVMMALDWFFSPLPLWLRWSMFAAWLAVVFVSARRGFAPVMRTIGAVQLARWVEHRHPEMQERISTALELEGQPAGVSAGLLDELRQAASNDAVAVDTRAEVRSVSTTRKWVRPALALVCVLFALIAIWPKQSTRLIVRAVAPFSSLGNAGAASFTIQPGSIELLEGDRFSLTVGYSGEESSMALITEWENGQRSQEILTRQGNEFLYELNPVSKSFRYKLRAGRAESDAYSVTVWPVPTLVDARLEITPPEYLGLIALNEPLSEQHSAVSGSRFRLLSQTNTAIEAVQIISQEKVLADATITTASGISQLDCQWTMEEPGLHELIIRGKHRLGRDFDLHHVVIDIREDLPPQVVLLSPLQKELKLRMDEILELRYEITEDFSLVRNAIELNDGKEKTLALGQNLPPLVDGSKPPRYRGGCELSVGDLMTRMGGAREFRLRVKAQDAKPSERSGPGIGYSEWVQIRIDENAESLVRQELRQQHEGAMQEIDKAIQEVRQARERMDWHKEEVKQAKLSENAEKNLTEAAEKLANAQEKINELAQDMQESVHASLASELKQAAEKMQQSRENMENAPLQDDADQRMQKLQQARDGAEESIKKLEQVKQEMQKDNEKIQDLVQLQELAQRQQEVARQAQQLAQQSPESSSEKPQEAQQQQQKQQQWQQQQDQLKEQIRQELAEQPQAMAEALQQQAEQAQQLAERAKQEAQSQQQLQQQAQELAQPEKQLSEQSQQAIQQALAREQEAIAQDTASQLDQAREQRSELADQLPEAANATQQAQEKVAEAANEQSNEQAAESANAAQQSLEKSAQQAQQLAEQAAQNSAQQAEENAAEPANETAAADGEQGASEANEATPAQAADQAKEMAQQQAQAEQQAAALEKLSERQEHVAEALEALAQGNQAEALESLQQAQAERAAELAQDIAALPQAQPSGAMQQAEQQGKQGSAQASQAAEQAGKNQQNQAAQQHQQAQQSFERSAEALTQAAAEMSKAAQQASQQPTPQQQAQASAQDLAEAFSQASQASENAEPQQAAQQAQQAAQALQQAARSARSQMQGNQPSQGPGQPGQPEPAQQPGQQPGQDPIAGERPQDADPGVPPELAKLGISAADWEKIQANLRSDVGAGGASSIPEEYRELVKGYFQSMSSKKSPPSP